MCVLPPARHVVTPGFRSVTLVGEKERKVLKEVVKQAKLPVKSRIVPTGMCVHRNHASPSFIEGLYRSGVKVPRENSST